jgi:hypothetical protein
MVDVYILRFRVRCYGTTPVAERLIGASGAVLHRGPTDSNAAKTDGRNSRGAGDISALSASGRRPS